MGTILVTGGAGYIGSHMVKALACLNREFVIIDDLSAGHSDAVPEGSLVRASISDRDALDTIFRRHTIDAVIHFAGSIEVGRSVREPLAFYRNNVAATLVLLEAMQAYGVDKLVFSSTAAVYGLPDADPIPETANIRPINPYGQSKAQVEAILADLQRASRLRTVCLRYFNAAGAHPDGSLCERHDPETHLIPLALAAMAGRGPALQVFGNDYATPDGTCLRDYIHVVDLANAHIAALDHLLSGADSMILNVGSGHGASVLSVMNAIERVCHRPVPFSFAPRRAGDPHSLVADNRQIGERLPWTPGCSDIETIVEDAWRALSRRWAM